jgi:hypothetical protein
MVTVVMVTVTIARMPAQHASADVAPDGSVWRFTSPAAPLPLAAPGRGERLPPRLDLVGAWAARVALAHDFSQTFG